jgi:hypothetical protein
MVGKTSLSHIPSPLFLREYGDAAFPDYNKHCSPRCRRGEQSRCEASPIWPVCLRGCVRARIVSDLPAVLAVSGSVQTAYYASDKGGEGCW